MIGDSRPAPGDEAPEERTRHHVWGIARTDDACRKARQLTGVLVEQLGVRIVHCTYDAADSLHG
ncbi:MAG: hypothetical protein JWO62_2424 [Acidimicrobiaceae bacterium]|nr:hypothetical protein [Acidimicrobiaceae bacterium]